MGEKASDFEERLNFKNPRGSGFVSLIDRIQRVQYMIRADEIDLISFTTMREGPLFQFKIEISYRRTQSITSNMDSMEEIHELINQVIHARKQ